VGTRIAAAEEVGTGSVVDSLVSAVGKEAAVGSLAVAVDRAAPVSVVVPWVLHILCRSEYLWPLLLHIYCI
jgi:hypothetical protein